MNTIERVARGIHHADDMDGGYDETKPFFEGLAKAAIEALCEGLEMHGRTLWFNDQKIGAIYGGYSSRSPHKISLMGDAQAGEYVSFDDASEALMSRARNWIMGE